MEDEKIPGEPTEVKTKIKAQVKLEFKPTTGKVVKYWCLSLIRIRCNE